MCMIVFLYIHVVCAYSVRGDQKTSDALVLRLQMTVCHHVNVGNRTKFTK